MFKTLRQAPFLRLVLFFILGIVIQYYVDVSPYYFVGFGVSFLFLFISLIPLFYQSYNFRWLFGCGILGLSFFFASFLTRNELSYSDWNLPREKHNYRVLVLEDPVQKLKSKMLRVQLLQLDESADCVVVGKKVILYLGLDSLVNEIVAGDCLSVCTVLDKPQKIPGNESFDYPEYLRKQGYAAVGYVAPGYWKQEKINASVWDRVRFQALACRRDLLVRLHEMLPDKETYSVAAAMILGYKNEMDKDMLLRFSDTGASHVLSISGMHVAILYGVIYFLLSFLGKKTSMRILRQLIILSLMWWFAFLTGLSPSVVRATIMISFAGIGEALSQRSLTFNIVGASAFLMLLYSPLSLFNVGFQLSFMAVLGIIIVNPLLVGLYTSRWSVMKYIWELCCVSTSAQLGTFPLSVYYFHQFPFVFLITNLFVIPLVGVLMVLIPVSLLFYSIFQTNPKIFIPINGLLHFFVSGVGWMQQIPFGVLSGLQMDILQTGLLYVAIVFAGLAIVKKRIVYLYLLALLVLFQVFYYLCYP